MSIDKIRKSVLVVAGIAVIAAAGLFAGRLSAGALHGGKAPHWLFERMTLLAREMVLAILSEEGTPGLMRRLAERPANLMFFVKSAMRR